MFKKTLFALLLAAPMYAGPERALYSSLDPHSVAEALAFSELYPDVEETEQANKRVAQLLGIPFQEPIRGLFSLINRLKGGSENFTEEEICWIEKMADHLPNRKLKGYRALSEAEVIALPSEEIDLGKALIFSQLGKVHDALFQARSYSAMLDLMAMQILSHLPQGAPPLDKIHTTNRFIFDQLHFRFPPHSVYAENIDLYTFLPSVMDNHLGVCLGVTALYLAIAQRIDLPLEIITPPGHIYVRYRIGEKTINIETTARGVHMPDETYLSLHNPTLEQRSLKEVIGMTHINQASSYLHKGDFLKASQIYEKALPYMQDDPFLNELLGYSYLFTDKKNEGEKLLKEVGKGTHTIAEDYLAGKVDLDGIRTVFLLVDETRESLLKKQKELESAVEKYPAFRDGLHQLATTWIQLNRGREAVDCLTRYFALDPDDAVINYYLAALHGERHDFKKSWRYLKCAEEAVQKDNFYPKALRELRRSLSLLSPE